MGNIIKITPRRNLFYIINLIIYYYIRKAVLIIINKTFKFNDSLIFTILMLTGEFFAGLSIYIYQMIFLKKDIKQVKHFNIVFTIFRPKMNRSDNILKIILLLFFSASFDFVEFIVATFYIPKFAVVSPTAEYRFGGWIIILGALLCHFNLKIKLLKHQFYSLVITGICLLIIIILEIIYRGKGVSVGEFCKGHMLVLAYLFFVPFTDVIEKYLMEFNFVNPFLTLMVEAIFGVMFILIYSAGEDPLKELKKVYKDINLGNFVLLIFLLFLYFAFSGGVNVYKILTNGLYSPMTKTLAVYILNPFLYIYYFIIENDFMSGGKRNWFYFIANVIIAIFISFLGCLFNEYFILSCCNLDYETHFSISKRASNENLDKEIMSSSHDDEDD